MIAYRAQEVVEQNLGWNMLYDVCMSSPAPPAFDCKYEHVLNEPSQFETNRLKQSHKLTSQSTSLIR
jgi:hypothetical protein